jgi:hypothetical protein
MFAPAFSLFSDLRRIAVHMDSGPPFAWHNHVFGLSAFVSPHSCPFPCVRILFIFINRRSCASVQPILCLIIFSVNLSGEAASSRIRNFCQSVSLRVINSALLASLLSAIPTLLWPGEIIHNVTLPKSTEPAHLFILIV